MNTIIKRGDCTAHLFRIKLIEISTPKIFSIRHEFHDPQDDKEKDDNIRSKFKKFKLEFDKKKRKKKKRLDTLNKIY